MAIRIIYTGVDPETPSILAREKDFALVAVAAFEYLHIHTCNPANLYMRLLYILRQKNIRTFELLLFPLWFLLRICTTGVYKKYTHFIHFLVAHRVAIIDLDEPTASKHIKDTEIDLMVVNAWSILPQSIIEAPRLGTLNIHPSKLPQYRGALPTLWSLKNGDTESAVSYMLLNDTIDGGNILAQHTFPITPADTALTLEHKIANIIKRTLAEDIRAYARGELTPHVQDERIASTTAKYQEYRLIDWEHERAVDIYNKVTLYPYLDPETYCYFVIRGRKIQVRGAKIVLYDENTDAPETIYSPHTLTVRFHAQDGILIAKLFSDLKLTDSIFLLVNKPVIRSI